MKRWVFLGWLLCSPVFGQSENVRFGTPRYASEPGKDEAVLLSRKQYVLSYSAKLARPNWVSWRLVADDLGHLPRGPFEPDHDLPASFPRITPAVYSRSGFDRGHMIPAADRAKTKQDSAAVFLMTNIVPQAPFANERPWEKLEEYCRELAKGGKELHIVCGPAGLGGEGRVGMATSIVRGKAKVAVPAHCWKAILVLPEYRAIAVILPNVQTVQAWTNYRVAIEDVEELTGLALFPDLDPDIAAKVRGQIDSEKE